MTIVLCNCFSDPRVIRKTYTEIATTTATPYGNISIMAPTFVLRREDIELQGVNYVYVPDWARYYFVKNARIQSGDIWILDCAIDVLQSYATAILQSPAVCVANETVGANMVNDPNFPIYPDPDQTVYEFSDSDFNITSATGYSRNFVLNVSGGRGE